VTAVIGAPGSAAYLELMKKGHPALDFRAFPALNAG
jgi:hypothetical protein